MKKILAILLSLLTLLSCGLLSACSAEKTQPDTPDTETVWETVSEAYIYAFPLVLTDATKTLSTNTDGTMTGRAPINQFNHVKKLADASFRTVVTPNVDTVYSQAWLDISTEPMVYVLPETDRFCNVQLLDAWTNTAAVLDKAGAYAIALPGWEGELPDGVTRIDVPTATAPAFNLVANEWKRKVKREIAVGLPSTVVRKMIEAHGLAAVLAVLEEKHDA